jgi:hypothetical protein
MFADTESTIWQAVIAGVVTVVLAYFQYRTRVAVNKGMTTATNASDLAARRVESVRSVLATNTTNTDNKLAGLAEVAEQTHRLVNSASDRQMKAIAVALRRIADLTKTADDIDAAEKAEKLLAEQIARGDPHDHVE